MAHTEDERYEGATAADWYGMCNPSGDDLPRPGRIFEVTVEEREGKTVWVADDFCGFEPAPAPGVWAGTKVADIPF